MPENRLYQLHADAVKTLELGPQFNWKLSFECAAEDLCKLEMTDVRADAEAWRSEAVPADFYFTHAQFYTDGVKHIINELKDKPTSNRALYSLIAQDHIRATGDNPIPSFLVLQCQIDNDVLYCTCYFRALEVSRFFKINLEEIRQTLVEIHIGVPRFSKVHLTIFAFRAYTDKNRSSLRRPKLETLHDDELLALLIDTADNPVRTLDSMLRELREAVTAVSAEKLESLKRILSYNRPQIKIPKELKKPLFIDKLEAAIAATTALAELRRKGSHGGAVDAATQTYQMALDALCAELNA